MTITAKDFKRVTKRRFTTEEIPGFGEVRIRSLSAREQYRMFEQIPEGPGSGFYQFAILALWTLVDKKGGLLFPHEIDESGFPVFRDEDREELAQAERFVLTPLNNAIKKHLRLIEDEEIDEETKEKN